MAGEGCQPLFPDIKIDGSSGSARPSGSARHGAAEQSDLFARRVFDPSGVRLVGMDTKYYFIGCSLYFVHEARFVRKMQTLPFVRSVLHRGSVVSKLRYILFGGGRSVFFSFSLFQMLLLIDEIFSKREASPQVESSVTLYRVVGKSCIKKISRVGLGVGSNVR